MAYQLKITLNGIQPPVWRRVLVEPTMTMEELHYVIQTLFDWSCEQQYYFWSGKRRIIDPDDDGEEHDEFSSDILIGQTFRKAGDRWSYLYDFEDKWEHEVLLEEIKDLPSNHEIPDCIDGAGNNPPENSGGAVQHLNNLAVLKNPKDPAYEDVADLYGDDYDPAYFDKDEVNADFRDPDNWEDEDDDLDYDED